MLKLFKELRRRHVFRAIGLYIGGTWILLQVADVVLPAYEAPEWIIRAMLSVAAAGLPIAVWLAWLFDITAHGIRHTADADAVDDNQEIALGAGRKADFIVIAILLVALGGSLFVNFSPREPVIQQDLQPLSVLIADFNNATSEPVFDGTLEQVLSIGLEESTFLTAFDRTTASRILADIDPSSRLDESGARLVSAREGISVVISGEVSTNKGKFEVSVFEVNAASGERLNAFQKRANSRSDVLMVVGELARKLREQLGDVNVSKSSDGQETFTTVSIEAMHDYVLAQRLARDGKDDEALGLYQSAVKKDPQFGRAWSGLAVSAHKLGNTALAEETWPKVLQLLDGMTERERYRTAGVYYNLVARNSQKAIENYEKLVAKYPADDAGHNNLAVAYFLDLQFDKALQAGRKVLEIYPTRPMYHANYALYAMYANDFKTATAEAAETLKLNPDYAKAYLPFAVAAMVEGDTTGAREAYEKMAATGARGASLASIGLADLMLWSGDPADADTVLLEGISFDETSENYRGVATKKMMRAYALWRQQADAAEIEALIEQALTQSDSLAQLVQAALLYVELDRLSEAADIAEQLGSRLESQQRAYSKMITALLHLNAGRTIDAIEELQKAVSLADVWLIRFYLGGAYAAAGHFAEAVSEYRICQDRLGEAYSLFLNDTPTFRYTKDLPDLMAQATQSMTAQHPDGAAPN